jgi:hypothetical protein
VVPNYFRTEINVWAEKNSDWKTISDRKTFLTGNIFPTEQKQNWQLKFQTEKNFRLKNFFSTEQKKIQSEIFCSVGNGTNFSNTIQISVRQSD